MIGPEYIDVEGQIRSCTPEGKKDFLANATLGFGILSNLRNNGYVAETAKFLTDVATKARQLGYQFNHVVAESGGGAFGAPIDVEVTGLISAATLAGFVDAIILTKNGEVDGKMDALRKFITNTLVELVEVGVPYAGILLTKNWKTSTGAEDLARIGLMSACYVLLVSGLIPDKATVIREKAGEWTEKSLRFTFEQLAETVPALAGRIVGGRGYRGGGGGSW